VRSGRVGPPPAVRSAGVAWPFCCGFRLILGTSAGTSAARS
jgi:hypothetical protein